MNDELTMEILKVLQNINLSLCGIDDELTRLNENIENVTGTFQNRTFLNVVASVHEE